MESAAHSTRVFARTVEKSLVKYYNKNNEGLHLYI